jgi:sulfite exporter TauE/SafE
VPALTGLALLVLAYRVWSGRRGRLVQLSARTASDRPALFTRLVQLAPREPAVFGALTALLPCAALGAALVLAAGTQARASGAALMLGFAATSALGVLGGGIVLARITQVGGRIAPRVLATALVLAALYVGLRPLYRSIEPGAAMADSCH